MPTIGMGLMVKEFHGTPLTIEPQKNRLLYRVYRARYIGSDEPFLFTVNLYADLVLRREIEEGYRKIDVNSIELIHETYDVNEALNIAEHQF